MDDDPKLPKPADTTYREAHRKWLLEHYNKGFEHARSFLLEFSREIQNHNFTGLTDDQKDAINKILELETPTNAAWDASPYCHNNLQYPDKVYELPAPQNHLSFSEQLSLMNNYTKQGDPTRGFAYRTKSKPKSKFKSKPKLSGCLLSTSRNGDDVGVSPHGERRPQLHREPQHAVPT